MQANDLKEKWILVNTANGQRCGPIFGSKSEADSQIPKLQESAGAQAHLESRQLLNG